MSDSNKQEIEGNIHMSDNLKQSNFSTSEQYSTSNSQTLDEPVIKTIGRDIKSIGFKLCYVLMPKKIEDFKADELRNWDLWGPLLLCLMLATTLSLASDDSNKLVFATIFFLIWVGAAIVTLNAKLLGGQISCFQSVCVLGYCIFPINLSAIICALIGDNVFLVKLAFVLLSFIWSSYSAVGFMGQLVSKEKQILGVYPVVLFYLFLAWYSIIVE